MFKADRIIPQEDGQMRDAKLQMLNKVGGTVLSFVLCAAPASLGGHQQEANARDFSFPCAAHTFFVQDAGKPVASVSSPDKLKRVVLEDSNTFSVVANGRALDTFKYYEMNGPIYVGWSPDSSQFFVMYSDGDWHVHIFTVKSHGIQELKMPRAVLEDFGKKHSCKTRDNGVLFLSWTQDSRKVFLVAEVHPTSDCGSEAGRFAGYLMQVDTGEILQRFDENETTKIEKDCRAGKTLKLPARRNDASVTSGKDSATAHDE